MTDIGSHKRIIEMPCEPISNFVMDTRSQAALDRIAAHVRAGKLLTSIVTVGVFSSIFTKSNAPVAAWNITQTDWEMYAQAMNAIPTITKAAIQREMDFMLLHYSSHHDRKHLVFWRGMRYGCR